MFTPEYVPSIIPRPFSTDLTCIWNLIVKIPGMREVVFGHIKKWFCTVYDERGHLLGQGYADTETKAGCIAWLNAQEQKHG